MPYFYLDPDFEADPTKIPNVEVFAAAYAYCPECGGLSIEPAAPSTGFIKPCRERECQKLDVRVKLAGWGFFWWFCQPGCLPEVDEPNGPFDSEAEALADARHD